MYSTHPISRHRLLQRGKRLPPGPGDERADDAVAGEAAAVPADAVKPFDWDAARLRNTAMEAIRAIAGLPEPQAFTDAWMKSSSYGEPIETLQAALAWSSGDRSRHAPDAAEMSRLRADCGCCQLWHHSSQRINFP
jgi:hypothetical protein